MYPFVEAVGFGRAGKTDSSAETVIRGKIVAAFPSRID
jgi:hypothetical protein